MFSIESPPTHQERRDLEALCVKALMSMEGDLKGDYHPLHGSRSYGPKPGGMSEEKEEALRAVGNLFQKPDSPLLLASGMGRHWPGRRRFNRKNFGFSFGLKNGLRFLFYSEQG